MARKYDISAMPFDTKEWLGNRFLRALPFDVRCHWVDMLCYMWESSERGYMVKPNGVPFTREEIKRLIGVDSSGDVGWLDDMISIGLCAVRESDGAYYSRRMVKIEAIRQKRREAGSKGGNVKKGKIFQPKQETPPEPPEKPLVEQQTELFNGETPEAPLPLTPEQKAKAEKAKKYKYAEFVSMTRDEYAKLCEQFSEDVAKQLIQILDNYKGSKGKKYKSDYRAILTWVVDSYNEKLQRNGKVFSGTVTGNTEQTGDGYRDTL